MSEADVGFSLGEVDPLNGWPVGQRGGPNERPGGSEQPAEVGLTTLGQPRLSEGAQPYPLQETGWLARAGSFGCQVTGTGDGSSGSGGSAIGSWHPGSGG